MATEELNNKLQINRYIIQKHVCFGKSGEKETINSEQYPAKKISCFIKEEDN